MNATSNKYMMVLQYICGQKSFHPKNTMRDFKVSNNFLTAGKEMGLFKRIGKSEYAWNLNRAPLLSDVHGIMVRIRASNKTQDLKPKVKGQLTIKPIKRVEYKAPVQPDLDVINYDRTNSKIAIILAVGAIIGFLIATLIWK
jgi:hypothetical protein